MPVLKICSQIFQIEISDWEEENEEAGQRGDDSRNEEPGDRGEMAQPGNQVLSSPHMMEGQIHTELGHSINCSLFIYCFKLCFLNICDFLPFLGGMKNQNLSSHQVGKAQCPEWTES